MPVITRLYQGCQEAVAAAGRVEALALPAVETAIFGGETLRDYRDMRVECDPRTGARIQVPDPAPATATGAAVGAAVGGGAGLLAGLGVIVVPGFGPMMAAGWLVSALGGAAGGALAGGMAGVLVDLGVAQDDAAGYADALGQGGIAVSVRFPEEHRPAVEGALGRDA
ncbi:hypothetical protein [uncultured Paracoccus sp.]|uniref:hypothetical protein n=1 Tax=uncultured Paracoccus sp. TaxID=189685 RepID=UPI0025D5A333|nr:hypothetical protein [uncultured Paracoccus sp.]